MKTYFTLAEICKSSVAKKKHINNVPDDVEILDNINYLIDNLNALRDTWGAAVCISSGYRCEALNKAIGGAKDSQHLCGQAADIYPKNIEDLDKFKAFCRNYFKYHDFDQCINEPTWIHISFNKDKARKMFLKTEDKKTYKYWKEV